MLTSTQRRILNLFSDLIFMEDRHQYYLHGKNLPSVSSIVRKFFPPFDEKKMLPLSAAKASREEGKSISPEQLKQRWTKINEDACALGHKTHKFLENYTGLELPSSPQEKAGIEYLRSLKGKYAISFRELRAYSKEFSYAGTMDLPLQVLGNEAEQFIISDYKTNKDLFKAYEYLYPPFESMEASPFNGDQIQLSLYQIMLEEAGLNIVDRTIIHLREDGSHKIFPLWDLTSILRDYLKTESKYTHFIDNYN